MLKVYLGKQKSTLNNNSIGEEDVTVPPLFVRNSLHFLFLLSRTLTVGASLVKSTFDAQDRSVLLTEVLRFITKQKRRYLDIK